MESYQFARLRKIVRHAYANVPFYRQLYHRHRFQPEMLRRRQDVLLIPEISKRDLLHLKPEMITDVHSDHSRLNTRLTSGTSGVPSVIRRTWVEARLLNVCRWRMRFGYGLRPRDTIAAVVSPQGADPYLYRIFTAAGLFRLKTISCFDPPDVILDRLAAIRPDVIIGYPGTLELAAKCITGHHRDLIKPRFITTGAETLTPTSRSTIADGFGARVFNSYGSIELNLIAWECPATGALHTCDDSVMVEVINDGKPARPGEAGEMVGTTLHSFAMPFIRYRSGDRVVRGRDTCECGQPFSTLERIDGRIVDFFILPGGDVFHPYRLHGPISRHTYDLILQYQLIQDRVDHVTLRLVLSEPDRPADFSEMTVECQEMLGPGVSFEVKLADRIPPTRGGKLLTYRSLVKA